jgi:hypothetical protein
MVNAVEDDIHKGAISVEGLRYYGDYYKLDYTEESVKVEGFVRRWSDQDLGPLAECLWRASDDLA